MKKVTSRFCLICGFHGVATDLFSCSLFCMYDLPSWGPTTRTLLHKVFCGSSEGPKEEGHFCEQLPRFTPPL